jgi:SsrA-binding protein
LLQRYIMCHKILEILTKSIKRKLDTYNVLIKLRNSTFAHMALQKNVKIKNRKARFEYEILDTYSAGIVLAGTEIKAIREGKASIAESFCEFHNGELFVINMTVQEYSHATHFNHNPKNERKLLLNRSELKKLEKEVKNSGLTIIPLVLYTNDKGFAKMQIALSKGKKEFDKRDSIKDRDNKRDLSRIKKAFNN